MSELDLLRKEIERLVSRIEALEEIIRAKDIEERAALLQIVAGQERRLGIKKGSERSRVSVEV